MVFYYVKFACGLLPDIWEDDEMGEIQHILGITDYEYHCLFYRDNYPFKVVSENYLNRSKQLWIKYARKNGLYYARVSRVRKEHLGEGNGKD